MASPWIVYKGLFQKLQYTEIIRSGQKVGGVTFAELLDDSGKTMPHSSELGSVATITGMSDSGKSTLAYDAAIGKASKLSLIHI